MSQFKDYVQLYAMGQFEFGFALVEENNSLAIKVMVVDHDEFLVRTLGVTYMLEEAFSIVRDCIHSGFYINGLLFPGVPDYSFSSIANLVSAR